MNYLLQIYFFSYVGIETIQLFRIEEFSSGGIASIFNIEGMNIMKINIGIKSSNFISINN